MAQVAAQLAPGGGAAASADGAGRPSIICLDELEVTDIADAVVLRRLFDVVLERGVTFVFTSNSSPG